MSLLRRRSDEPASRGQTMVEFALILPLLALLLVMAIDFGRVFFGWVGLHNATRIAANHAAQTPQAWEPPGTAFLQAQYRDVVLNELESLNCDRPAGGSYTPADVPQPTFEEKPTSFSGSDRWEVGDQATVTIECRFELLTPLAGAIVGDPILIAASADFMVRGGVINGIPIGPAPPVPGCVDQTVPTLTGLSVAAARTAWTDAGFTGAFSPATGSDTEVVVSQATTPSSTPGDCRVATASVIVTSTAGTTCSGTAIQVPSLLGLTVAQARSTWTADFGAFTPATGSNTNVVSAQTTVPSSNPGDCREPSTSVTVTHAAPPPADCTVPQLVGVRVNVGQTRYTDKGFTGTYTATNPPNGNYIVTSQSLVFGQELSCASNMVVSGN
ncbi:MAG: TadE/TadG family type IV pilus assembly protein [Candidatus Limnocylindria bacterium]